MECIRKVFALQYQSCVQFHIICPMLLNESTIFQCLNAISRLKVQQHCCFASLERRTQSPSPPKDLLCLRHREVVKLCTGLLAHAQSVRHVS